VAAAPRKPSHRRPVKQAFVLVFLVFLAASAGTTWWTVTHRTIPGHPTAIGGTTKPTETPSQWVPTIVSPCSSVEVAREQTTDTGDKIRCQRTPTLEPPQHWVEEPPTGFPKSDPGGPFPAESCEADGDTAYSPVGDHLTCENETWQVTA
jgi:hypothetical protein